MVSVRFVTSKSMITFADVALRVNMICFGVWTYDLFILSFVFVFVYCTRLRVHVLISASNVQISVFYIFAVLF